MTTRRKKKENPIKEAAGNAVGLIAAIPLLIVEGVFNLLNN